MNIEIANRLVNLRKAHHLSQEELAAKIGISRQAVSKWERAEASPDTDNLIVLAKLYEISLDELLKTDEPIEIMKKEDADSGKDAEPEKVLTEGEKNRKIMWTKFPYPVFVTIVYLILGLGFKMWDMGWILFLTIPIYYWIAGLCKK